MIPDTKYTHVFVDSLKWFGVPRAVSLRPYTLDKSFWCMSGGFTAGIPFSFSYTLQKMAIFDNVRFKYIPDLYNTKQHVYEYESNFVDFVPF